MIANINKAAIKESLLLTITASLGRTSLRALAVGAAAPQAAEAPIFHFKLKRQSDTRRKRLRCASDSTNLQSSIVNIQFRLVRVGYLTPIPYPCAA
jgi:hypothetical protein